MVKLIKRKAGGGFTSEDKPLPNEVKVEEDVKDDIDALEADNVDVKLDIQSLEADQDTIEGQIALIHTMLARLWLSVYGLQSL